MRDYAAYPGVVAIDGETINDGAESTKTAREPIGILARHVAIFITDGR